jgi:hypothetical protein
MLAGRVSRAGVAIALRYFYACGGELLGKGMGTVPRCAERVTVTGYAG